MKAQYKKGIYSNCIKRLLDIVFAAMALVIFFWLYLLVALLIRIKLGKPVLFKQLRPGLIDPKTGNEQIFVLYKFRTMTDDRDENGELLPDEVRLTKFGKWLRKTSLDEIPEAWNILKGDMSFVGPRPQLVRDMVFMTEEQRRRHIVRPGLTGYAQVNGRNSITWEQKFECDIKYIEDGITFANDAKIVFKTVGKVLKRSDTVRQGTASDVDFGDWLLREGKVSREEYEKKRIEAEELSGIKVDKRS